MNWKFSRALINENSRIGIRFNLFIQFLIIVSLISFSIETLPNLSSRAQIVLDIVELVIVLVFTFEYLLRLFITRPTLKFVFSFFGIIDLLAILPFYLSLGVDLRSIRALRLIRLFRIFKLARYSKALNHFRRALIFSKVSVQPKAYRIRNVEVLNYREKTWHEKEQKKCTQLWRNIWKGMNLWKRYVGDIH
ncbi:MAG: ion transporter [Saprospiraceae bacterium]|nr:ion transporter [Saprospiraceae bacterium]